MYLAGVSVRRVEDITEALWGTKISLGTISELNKKAYARIEVWRSRPLTGEKYPYVYVDGIYLLHIQHFHSLPDSRMLNFLKGRDSFRLGIGKFRTIVEKWRQMPDIYIAVFVKGGGEHRSAMFLEIFFHIGTATEKGHSKGGFGNNHICSFLEFDATVRISETVRLSYHRIYLKPIWFMNFICTV